MGKDRIPRPGSHRTTFLLWQNEPGIRGEKVFILKRLRYFVARELPTRLSTAVEKPKSN
jgi:hypothetical protein